VHDGLYVVQNKEDSPIVVTLQDVSRL
jgi:hypothetical protein